MIKKKPNAFTLIELLVVMFIMALMMTIGVAGYFGIRRGADMRAAISSIRTSLMLGRQQAVTKRQKVRVEFVTAGETNLIRVLIETPGSGYQLVHQEAPLPRGIQYVGSPSPVIFTPVGAASAAAPVDVTIQEKAAQANGTRNFSSIRVWPLTGITKVQ